MNQKRKILLVSNGFYPEISPRSYRATELTKEFVRRGHDVTVISKYRNCDYTEFLKAYPIVFRMWRKPSFPKVPEFRRKPFSYISRILSRLLLTLFEYPAVEEMFIVRKALRKELGYDMVISFAVPYPVHWGVAWRRSSKNPIGKVWIADCGDPYMGDTLDSFRKPFYFGYIEKWFCRKADYITIPVESARPGYYPEFQNKIRVIPQGFDFDLNKKGSPFQQNEIPEFAYAGGFLKGIRDPRLLIQYLSELNIPFRFHVYTNQPEFLDEYRHVLKDNLIITGYIPRTELIEKLSKMDFLVNFDNHTTLNVPSKLIDYAIMNRPVMNIDKNFDISLLKEFLEGNYNRKMDLPDPEKYHIRNVSQQFLELLNDKEK